MKKAIILHGTQGSPDGNWFRWLERRLRTKGIKVWLPQLPHAEQPSLYEWLDFVGKNAPFTLDKDTMVIGHSSGATLSLLLSQEVGAVVAVSPFIPKPEDYSATIWEANAKLFESIDAEKILRTAQNDKSQKIVVYSDDDPYIPISVFTHITEIAGAKGVLLPSQGHFNLEKSLKYEKFPWLFSSLVTRGLV